MYYHIDLRIIVSAVWIVTTLVDGYPQFYVSTDVQYDENDVYFVSEGDYVNLTCEYPTASSRIEIWIAYSNRNFFSLAVNEQLGTDSNREKYSLTVNSGRNVLTIRGVSITDSAVYGCTVAIPDFCNRRICYFNYISNTLSLNVVADNVRNCTFVSNDILGTYFTGDGIVLSCPTDDISLSIRNGTEHDSSVLITIHDPIVTDVGDNLHLIYIPSINTTFNGTKLVCMNTENTIDLCENLTVITVYEDLMATVTPNSVDVPDGGSTELTCLSNLHDVVSFEFDIQYTNATAGNVSMSEVPGGMKVTITEINFQLDVASSGLVVSCNVTFGKRYAFGYATVNLMKTPPMMIPNVSTTQQLPDLEATSMPRASDNKVIVIVLPIAIVLVIIGIVAAILLYCKSARKGKPSLMQKNTSRQDEAKAANDQKMPDNDDYYLEPNNGNKILGLDQTDDYYLEPNNGKKVLSLDRTDDYYLEPNNGKKVLSLDQTDYEIVGNDAT